MNRKFKNIFWLWFCFFLGVGIYNAIFENLVIESQKNPYPVKIGITIIMVVMYACIINNYSEEK